MVARDPAEGGDDPGVDAAAADGGVAEVDDHVPGGVQRGGGGADRHGLARADLAGDHAEGVLVDAPADPGHGLGVAVVAVQHAGREAATEGHPGEAVVGLQAVEAHWFSGLLFGGTSSRRASMSSWSGSVRVGVAIAARSSTSAATSLAGSVRSRRARPPTPRRAAAGRAAAGGLAGRGSRRVLAGSAAGGGRSATSLQVVDPGRRRRAAASGVSGRALGWTCRVITVRHRRSRARPS